MRFLSYVTKYEKYFSKGWVYPICTISGDLIFKDYVGTYAEVAGWGFTDRDSEVLAHVLQTIQVKYLF